MTTAPGITIPGVAIPGGAIFRGADATADAIAGASADTAAAASADTAAAASVDTAAAASVDTAAAAAASVDTAAAASAVVRDALAGFAAPAAWSRDELLTMVGLLGEVQAVLDAVKVLLAGELVARSCAPGPENPVTRTGHSSAAALLAERWRIPFPAARQYCAVGDATRARVSLVGEVLPATLPLLADWLSSVTSGGQSADQVSAGWLSVDQAAVIVRELGKAALGCSQADLAVGERLLVDHAPDLTVAELRTLAAQVRDRLDQDGILPREARQRRRRSLTISTTSDGMTHVDWYLDPESAGYVVTAIDAFVGHELRKVTFGNAAATATTATATTATATTATATAGAGADDGAADGGDAAKSAESSTLAQIRSDAATDIFRHLAACTQTAVDGKPPVTMIVRIGLSTLTDGVGTGQIDGIPTPVSAGTVRRMAADANLIPVVLGAESEVLDLGRSRRLFSRAQKLALAERDGGCAWPGCPHPPSYTEAHHLRWWNTQGGETDLNNGILLCSSHHHRIHDDGWQIDIRNNVPWFIPPDHVDPRRRPRKGGRIQLPTPHDRKSADSLRRTAGGILSSARGRAQGGVRARRGSREEGFA